MKTVQGPESPARIFKGTVSDGDLRLLRVFKAVVDHAGFSAAEVSLNKSKSAISLDISHLERRLGVKLCSRGRSGFALTQEGQIVYLAALQLFADIDKFRDRVATATRQISGRLTLFLIDNIVSIAAAPLTQALGDFGKRHPKVALNVESATARGVEQAVLEGAADLGITVVPRPNSALEMLPIFREELTLYCGRKHPLARQDPATLTLEQLRDHPLVEPSVLDDPEFATLVAGFVTRARASNLDSRLLLVMSGGYLGFLPPLYAKDWVAKDELVPLLPETLRSENTFYILLKRSARQTAAAQEFLRLALAAFERAKDLTPPLGKTS